jgi:hypothetical protein
MGIYSLCLYNGHRGKIDVVIDSDTEQNELVLLNGGELEYVVVCKNNEVLDYVENKFFSHFRKYQSHHFDEVVNFLKELNKKLLNKEKLQIKGSRI